MMLFANDEHYNKNSIIVCHQVSHKYDETLFEAARSVQAFRYRVDLIEAGLTPGKPEGGCWQNHSTQYDLFGGTWYRVDLLIEVGLTPESQHTV